MQGDVPTMVKYQRCIKDIILFATYIRFLDKKRLHVGFDTNNFFNYEIGMISLDDASYLKEDECCEVKRKNRQMPFP